jgi:signal transduction histidine kinase
LNSILGFSDVLGSNQLLDEKQVRYVENIRKSGRMLLEMINDILDLAKMEAGKMDVRATTFELGSIVSAQCDMIRPMAEKKQIELKISMSDTIPKVEQDQSKLQQILSNLLSNAVKFTPEGGQIAVSGKLLDTEFFTLEVSDNGVGIAVDEQQAIFEKFRQSSDFQAGDDAMTREISGTGLGLSIVRELCRLLGGDVTVQSALGQGSSFCVRLPVCLKACGMPPAAPFASSA